MIPALLLPRKITETKLDFKARQGLACPTVKRKGRGHLIQVLQWLGAAEAARVEERRGVAQ